MKITTKSTPQGRQLIFEPIQNELPTHIANGISAWIALILTWFTHDWVYTKFHAFRGQSSTNEIDVFIASIIDHITSYGLAFGFYFIVSIFIIKAAYLFFHKETCHAKPSTHHHHGKGQS